MQKQNVQTLVKEYATENFNMYPEDYQVVDGSLAEEAALKYQDLAINYFANRNELEVERDESCDVAEIDYVDWVGEALSDWIEETHRLK